MDLNSGEGGVLRIGYFQRKAEETQFSLERVFETVRNALPHDVSPSVYYCPFQSRRIVKRVLNILAARFHQSDLNHIVGDVHYLALAQKKTKTILTIHDCGSLRLKTGVSRALLLWFWYRLPVRRVAAITVISEFTRDEVLFYTDCDPAIVHVIPDPLPAGFVARPRKFNAAKPVILQIGTGPHNKNINRVADALKGLSCCLDVIGRLTEEQRNRLSSNGVEFTEAWDLSDEQIIRKYQECDMVVFVSTYEGFGLPIVEANATGRPVVTSNIAPMSVVAGSAACLVDPFDSDSIRTGIVRVLSDEDYRNRLVSLGFENAKRFQADTISARYAALYRSVYTGAK